jgi:Cu+-exporting ATPase
MCHDHHHAAPEIPEGTETAKDPVCGMTVSIGSDTRHEEFKGKTLHFCSEKYQTKFKADPSLYAADRAAEHKKPAPANVQYTCPMHPEIIRDAPGACPICGMALEPAMPTDEPSVELTDFTRRMWISAAAEAPLIVLTLGPMVGLPVRDWLGHQVASYTEFALATPIVLWAALPFLRCGWDSLANRSPSMWTLIGLGVSAAYIYSLFATFLPGLFPQQYRSGDGVGTCFEASAVIVALVFFGQVLELRAHRRRHPRASGPCAKDCAPPASRRHRTGRPAARHRAG